MKNETRFDWAGLMNQWNNALLASKNLQNKISEEARKSRWLGHPAATDSEILALEARLKVELPVSYKEFLKFSNGWGYLNHYIYRVWDTSQVDWFRVRNQDWIDAWAIDGWLRSTLEVSDTGDDAIILLNPRVKTASGEWEALFFSTWAGHIIRKESFWQFMVEDFETFKINDRELLKIEVAIPTRRKQLETLIQKHVGLLAGGNLPSNLKEEHTVPLIDLLRELLEESQNDAIIEQSVIRVLYSLTSMARTSILSAIDKSHDNHPTIAGYENVTAQTRNFYNRLSELWDMYLNVNDQPSITENPLNYFATVMHNKIALLNTDTLDDWENDNEWISAEDFLIDYLTANRDNRMVDKTVVCALWKMIQTVFNSPPFASKPSYEFVAFDEDGVPANMAFLLEDYWSALVGNNKPLVP